jgi:hypothetical protein
VDIYQQAGLQVLLTERSADLSQIPGIRSHHDDLLPVQPGMQHQRIEAIALRGAAPHRCERVFEQPARRIGTGLRSYLVAQPEVINPPLCALGGSQLVGALVDHLNPHALEDRRHYR